MATVVGGIVLFLVGFLIWGLALAGWMETQVIGPAGMSKETPELVHIFLANLVYAGMLTLVVGSWAGRRSFAGGFSAGLTVGLLFSLSMALMFIGTMNFATPTAHLVDTIATGLWAGVGGGVVAMMLGRGESSA